MMWSLLIRLRLKSSAKKVNHEKYLSYDRRCKSSEIAEGVCKLNKGLLVVLNTRGILAEVDETIEMCNN